MVCPFKFENHAISPQNDTHIWLVFPTIRSCIMIRQCHIQRNIYSYLFLAMYPWQSVNVSYYTVRYAIFIYVGSPSLFESFVSLAIHTTSL